MGAGEPEKIYQHACTFIVIPYLSGNWSKGSLDCNCSSDYWNDDGLRVAQWDFEIINEAGKYLFATIHYLTLFIKELKIYKWSSAIILNAKISNFNSKIYIFI